MLSLFKAKFQVEEYIRLCRRYDLSQVSCLLELGIWYGGSVAFWNEFLQPHTHLGVDITDGPNSPQLQHYISSRQMLSNIRMYWATDQADRSRLHTILLENDVTSLDLVIDDASHRYSLTRDSFLALFPLVSPGGLYIIEDWSWAYHSMFKGKDPKERSPADLIVEMGELLASRERSAGVIASMSMYSSFVAIERGGTALDEGFALHDYIARWPHPGVYRRAVSKARRLAGTLRSTQ